MLVSCCVVVPLVCGVSVAVVFSCRMFVMIVADLLFLFGLWLCCVVVALSCYCAVLLF